MLRKTFEKLLLVSLLIFVHFFFFLAAADSLAAEGQETTAPQAAQGEVESPEGGPTAGPVTESITRQGVMVEFSARPSPGRSMTGEEIYAADFIDISFRMIDANTGQPLRGQFPGAWMDYSRSWEGKQTVTTSCKERVGLYLQGAIGIRPLIDLNSYFILVMNRDPSIMVIDPMTGITGITKLYAEINLKKPAGDWAKNRDESRLFVTMPRADELAIVDTETFKVMQNIQAGSTPMRVVMQPDGRYVWVGNNAKTPAESGVTVIDTDKLVGVKHIPTGRGHHEIVFTDDSLHAFVSNREEGTVSVIDTQRLAKIRDLKPGPLPISMDFSTLSKGLYVAEAEKGEIVVFDGSTFNETARIQAKPGLGALRFSQDGRWGVAVNSREDVAYVIDSSTNRIVHTLAVGKEPYQVAFSRSFAYVRSLGTERVSMINLMELGKPGTVPVVTFGAGEQAPGKVQDLSIAESIVETPGEAAAIVVSPADATVYYYMEGMNTPMGNFRNYGHMPMAVQVIDRSMKETEPGVYSATVRIPEAGTYDVAFLLDSPVILNCFQVAARPNPMLEPKGPRMAVSYLDRDKVARVGEAFQLRFRLTDRRTEQPFTDLQDVYITYFVAPGGPRQSLPVTHAGEGVYEASVPILSRGTHYVYVGCPSAGVKPNDLPFLTFRAMGEDETWTPQRGTKRGETQ